MIDDVQWFVGIDWATRSHRVCLLDVEGRHVSEHDFAHDGAGLTELRDWLLEKTKAAPTRRSSRRQKFMPVNRAADHGLKAANVS